MRTLPVFVSVCLLGGHPLFITPASAAPPAVSFARDIRPLLSDRCFHCHGPDARTRKSGLRLDTEAGLLGADGTAGAIVPRDPGQSKLWQRVTSSDAGERMPPAESGKELSPAELETLKLWIEQGGAWQGHWSFLPIARPQPPEVSDAHQSAVKNDVDRFIPDRVGDVAKAGDA